MENNEKENVLQNVNALTDIVDSLSLALDKRVDENINKENHLLLNEVLNKALKKLKTNVGRLK